MQIEDLGFCKKGEGGKFVADGNLISGVGKLPFNTDGGGSVQQSPANRGGITKMIEAVRQLRGEAHPKVQVPNCDLAIAHGTGGLARRAPRRGDRHSWNGSLSMSDTQRAQTRRIPAPAVNPESKPFWDAAKRGPFPDQALRGCGKAHWYPRLDLPVLLLPTTPSGKRARAKG